MPKIEIYKDERRRWVVLVDGVNMAPAIAAGTLRIEFPPGDDYPLVHMTLRAREMNVQLPEAVVEAVEALLPDAGREFVAALKEYEKRGRA